MLFGVLKQWYHKIYTPVYLLCMFPNLFHLILCCEHFLKSLVFKNMIFFFFNDKIPFHLAAFCYVSGTWLHSEVTDVNKTQPLSFLRIMPLGLNILSIIGIIDCSQWCLIDRGFTLELSIVCSV